MPIRLIHVSDTHLSETHGYFTDNWRAFKSHMASAPPDALVHGGDLSFNGPVAEGDLGFAAAEVASLGIPYRAISGNHDVGEAPDFSRLNQPINAKRVATWKRHFGAQWWHWDLGDWRLIGIDTALLASGMPEEAAQMAALREALATRGKRPVMLFMHMPPFDKDPTDPTRTTSVVPFQARATLLDLCAESGVKVICCGHLHIYRRLRHRGMEIVWAPATAMVDVARGLRLRRRFPRPGYVEWTLDGTRAAHRLVEPERMFVIDMTRWTHANGLTVTGLPARAAS
ncbi:MAG: hypothetical protein JWO24_2227 [Rhodospirillales bacterium]|nr:hypothetical protein [Rhodospirillales bacterium]